jgi:hypothetical protein
MGLHVLKKSAVVVGVLLCMSAAAFAAERTVAVIVGDEFPVRSLSVDEIAKIYKGDRLFLKGTRLTPLDNKDAALRSRFFQEAIGMSTDDFAVHWITRNFQDGLKIPEAVTSTEVLERIKEKGVLGFVDADDVKGKLGIHTLLTIDAP